MARWRRLPGPRQAIAHSDRGTAQYTSWVFGQRLRGAGLLGSMGSIGDFFDNSVAESFFGTLQLELLDTRSWSTRKELATAISDYIETFYIPVRRHSKNRHAQSRRLRTSPHRLPSGGIISTANQPGKPQEPRLRAVCDLSSTRPSQRARPCTSRTIVSNNRSVRSVRR
ncbi:IS3 family transposase [Nocardia sp. NPDC052001]|uniref:IS3 family transposase n=1 Tax=Nocardia sp. NPDC052001 TaxID=3154853 RepID=UPI003447D6BF